MRWNFHVLDLLLTQYNKTVLPWKGKGAATTWTRAACFVGRLLLGMLAGVCAVAFLRAAVPTLSGIPSTFPANVSASLLPEEFNFWRLQQANHTLASTSTLKGSKGGDVGVSIIASGREGGFLTQTLAGLVTAFPDSSIHLSYSLCDVSSTEDEEIYNLSKIINVVRRDQGDLLNENAGYEQRIGKETRDYWWCLGEARHARYSLILEDDVVTVPYFFTLLGLLVRKMDKNVDVDYVKLYHPGGLRRLPYYFQLATFSLVISETLTIILWRSFNAAFSILLVAFMMYHIHIHYTYQLFVDLRYAVSGEVYWGLSESCCTPAVLFRRSSVPRMLAHFRAVDSGVVRAKDDLLDRSPFTARQTDTNYVVHIGYISTVRNSRVTVDSLKYLKRRANHFFPF